MATSGYIIYGLIDPRDGQLRYVGKSSYGLARASQHICPSALKNETYRTHWLRGLLSAGIKPEAVILEECSVPQALNEAEQHAIAYYRFLGCNLTNLTAGGDGQTGHRFSEAHREALSRVQRGGKKPWATREARQGRPGWKEWCRAISEGKRGKKVSAVTLQKMMVARPGRKIQDNHGNIYWSVGEAARILGIDRAAIRRAVNGKTAGSCGRTFRYLET